MRAPNVRDRVFSLLLVSLSLALMRADPTEGGIGSRVINKRWGESGFTCSRVMGLALVLFLSYVNVS